MKRIAWFAPILLAVLLFGCDGFGFYGKVTNEQVYADHISATLTMNDNGPENDARFIMYEVFNLACKHKDAERLTLQILVITKSKEQKDFGRHSWDDLSNVRSYENKLEYAEKEKSQLLSLRRKLTSLLEK